MNFPPPPQVAATPIDYFARCNQPTKLATITLGELIEEIRSVKHAEPITELRGVPYGERGSIKSRLPAVTLSSHNCEISLREASLKGEIKHTGLLQIDIDGSGNRRLAPDHMRQILLADPHIVAVFLSPSGDGMKGVCLIPADPDRHRESYFAAEMHFANLGLWMDSCTDKSERYCTVSHDPLAVIRDGIDLPVPDGTGLRSSKPVREAAIRKALASMNR